MLGGGEYTAVWWITPKNYGVEGRDYTTPADFADMFNGDFNNRENRVSTDGSDGRKINLTPVSITIEDPATGVKSFAPGRSDLRRSLPQALLDLK